MNRNVVIALVATCACACACERRAAEAPATRPAGPSSMPSVSARADEAAATVNGVVITRAAVDHRLRGGHGRGAVTDEMRKDALDKLVDLELLHQEGIRLGLDRDQRYRAKVRKMELDLAAFQRIEMARRLNSTQVAAKISVTSEDARRYYEAHASELRAECHLVSIRFASSAQAQDALAKLDNGAKFDDLVPQAPGAPTHAGAREPHTMGWSQLPDEWVDAVVALAPGGHSGVLQGRKTGVRIVRLVERKTAADQSFEAARGTIMRRMAARQEQSLRGDYLRTLRDKAEITIGGRSP